MNKSDIQKLINNAPSSWKRMFDRYGLSSKPKVDKLIDVVLDYTPTMRSSGPEGPALYKVPAKVRKEAEKGLKLAWEHNWTSDSGVGLVRAMQLVVMPKIWERSVKRMKAYFTRHEVDKQAKNFANDKKPSRGYIAWLAWGGDSGQVWAEQEVAKMKMKENPYEDLQPMPYETVQKLLDDILTVAEEINPKLAEELAEQGLQSSRIRTYARRNWTTSKYISGVRVEWNNEDQAEQATQMLKEMGNLHDITYPSQHQQARSSYFKTTLFHAWRCENCLDTTIFLTGRQFIEHPDEGLVLWATEVSTAAKEYIASIVEGSAYRVKNDSNVFDAQFAWSAPDPRAFVQPNRIRGHWAWRPPIQRMQDYGIDVSNVKDEMKDGVVIPCPECGLQRQEGRVPFWMHYHSARFLLEG